MQVKAVISTNISRVAYYRPTQDLYLLFKSGSAYRYAAVPEQVHTDFLNASSHGSFLNAVIKPSYSFERLDDATRDDVFGPSCVLDGSWIRTILQSISSDATVDCSI